MTGTARVTGAAGSASRARWPRPDFLAGASRPPVAARVFALGGIVALLAAGTVAWSTHAEFERLARDSRSTTTRDPGRPRSSEVVATTEGDADARRAARRVSKALAYPWSAVLASLETATPAGVRWLEFDHSADGGEIRLEGLAADATSALRAADSFGAAKGWRDVTLVRLQRVDGRDVSSAGLRFSIEARIDPAPLLAAGSDR